LKFIYFDGPEAWRIGRQLAAEIAWQHAGLGSASALDTANQIYFEIVRTAGRMLRDNYERQ
jgi:hypothetical protein